MSSKGGRDRYKRKESGPMEPKLESGRGRDSKGAPYVSRYRRGVGDRTPPRFRIYEETRPDDDRYGPGDYAKDDRSGEGRRSERPGSQSKQYLKCETMSHFRIWSFRRKAFQRRFSPLEARAAFLSRR